MEERDVFDVVLVVIFALVFSLDRYATVGSIGRPGAVIDVVRSLDIAVYLVIAGILGVVFVGYIAIYLPYKQSETTSR